MSFLHLETEGVVTDDCMPYASGTGVNGFCHYSCTDPTMTYQKYFCEPGSLNIQYTIDGIMQELQTNGPMYVAFATYLDFETY